MSRTVPYSIIGPCIKWLDVNGKSRALIVVVRPFSRTSSMLLSDTFNGPQLGGTSSSYRQPQIRNMTRPKSWVFSQSPSWSKQSPVCRRYCVFNGIALTWYRGTRPLSCVMLIIKVHSGSPPNQDAVVPGGPDVRHIHHHTLVFSNGQWEQICRRCVYQILRIEPWIKAQTSRLCSVVVW